MSRQDNRRPKRVKLEMGEEILHHGPANRVTNHFFGLNTGGWLYLTPNRLIFEDLLGDGFHVTDLKNIAAVTKAMTKACPIPIGLVPNSIRLRDRQGEVLAQFVVKARSAWIDKLSSQLGANSQP